MFQKTPSTILMAIVFAHCLINLGILYWHGPQIHPDTYSYITPGTRWLQGLGFTFGDGSLDANRVPVYPVLSAILNKFLGLGAIVVFQIIFSSLSIVLVYKMALIVYAPSALFAAFVYAIDPLVTEYNQSILSDATFTVMTLIATYLVISLKKLDWKGAAFLGTLLGFLTLIRPLAVFLPLVFVGYLAIRFRKNCLIFVLTMLVAFSVLPISWSYRNYRSVGIFAISDQGPVNLMLYKAAGVMALIRPGNFIKNLEDAQNEMNSLVANQKTPNMSPTSINALHKKIAKEYLTEHPIGTLILMARGMIYIMLGGSVDFLSQLTGIPVSLMRYLIFCLTIPSLLLALWGLLKLYSIDRNSFYLFLGLLLYFSLIPSGAEAGPRFRLPLTPFLATLIGVSLPIKLER